MADPRLAAIRAAHRDCSSPGSRCAVPELLDLVDRLEAENQQLRANLEEVKGQLANCHKFIAKAVPPGTFVVMSDD